jgi:hypothetical protein
MDPDPLGSGLEERFVGCPDSFSEDIIEDLNTDTHTDFSGLTTEGWEEGHIVRAKAREEKEVEERGRKTYSVFCKAWGGEDDGFESCERDVGLNGLVDGFEVSL